jgi:hypothetical protein
MAFAFDTLGYAKKLREAGVPQPQAEAHAEAAREFVMAELVTRYDLDATRRELDTAIAATRRDLDTTRRELDTAIAATRNDLDTTRRDLDTAIAATRNDLETAITTTRRDLEGAIERLALRMTVRTGVMLAAGLTVLAAVLKLH